MGYLVYGFFKLLWLTFKGLIMAPVWIVRAIQWMSRQNKKASHSPSVRPASRATGATESRSKPKASPPKTGALRRGDDGWAPLYWRALGIVAKTKEASVSNLRTWLKVDAETANTLLAAMEEDGYIDAPNAEGERPIYVTSAMWDEIQAKHARPKNKSSGGPDA